MRNTLVPPLLNGWPPAGTYCTSSLEVTYDATLGNCENARPAMGATLADAMVLSSDILYLPNTFCLQCYDASVTVNLRLPFRLLRGGALAALVFGPGAARGSAVVLVVCAASLA